MADTIENQPDNNIHSPTENIINIERTDETVVPESPVEKANEEKSAEEVSKDASSVEAENTDNEANYISEEKHSTELPEASSTKIGNINIKLQEPPRILAAKDVKRESLSENGNASRQAPLSPRASNASRRSKESVDADADMLESVLFHVGDMGRYQKLLFLAMMPFGFFFAFIYFVQMFIDVAPANYWCKVPELEHLDLEMRRYLSAPGAAAGGSWDSCKTFDVDWNDVLTTMQPPPDGTPLISCPNGWDFEFTDIPYETVVTQRGWVCEYASYAPTAQSLFFAGSLVGSLFFGWLADIYGRVPALVGSNLIGAVGGIATIFTSGVWDFFLCRFIVGMSLDTAFMSMYILVLEYVGYRHRTWVANMSIALYFGGGCMVLPWIALWMNDWRKLLWFTTLPMFIVLLVPFTVPESARWLVSRGRINDAVKVLKRFERVNGTKIPQDVMDEFVEAAKETKVNKQSILVVFKNPLLRICMICLVMVYMSCCIIFDGLVRMSNVFGLNYFITFTVTSATEIPSIAILTLVLDRWGRRNLTAGPMSIAGVMILSALFVPTGYPQAGLAIAARFFINMSFNTVLQWVTEMLPTPVRASGSAMMHMSGYLSIVISPFIVYSEVAWSLLPLLILGFVAVFGAVMTLFLPETKGLPMPMTMEDSEWLVKQRSLCRKPEKEQDVETVNVSDKPAT